MPSLAVKYRPQNWDDVSEQSVIVDMLKGLCQKETLDCRNFLLIGPAGCGKAQPLTSLVLTTQGFVPMGDIRVGDTVYTAKGNVSNVSEIHPQGFRDVYKIALSDGTFIEVSDEHLNEVYTVSSDNSSSVEYTMTTTALKDALDGAANDNPFYIKSPQLDWAKSDVLIDPYLFGGLLSLQFSISGIFCLHAKDTSLVAKLSKILERDWGIELSHIPGSPETYWYFLDKVTGAYISRSTYEHPFVDAILSLEDCSPSEFYGFTVVPVEYQQTSIDDRWSLIQALVDSKFLRFTSHGAVCTCKYIGISEGLTFIFRSLGFIDYVKMHDGTYEHCVYVDESNLSKYPFNTFEMYDLWVSGRRRILWLVQTRVDRCQCIMLDHSDHTYISNGFIPTHNTTSARIMANTLNEGRGEPIEIDAASHGSVDAIREIVQQARTYPVGSKYKIFIIDEVHAVSKQGWSVFLKTLEESPAQTVFLLCTTNPENIPDTIISRVQVFQLSKISLEGIQKRLKFVLDSEIAEGRQIHYTDDAVNFIAKLANGGMRDALTLLDKALTYSEELNAETIAKSLNLPAYDDFFELLNAIARKDNVQITRTVHQVYNSGVNFVKWFQEFHSFVMNIVKYINLKDINLTMIPSTYENKISSYSEKHIVVCLKLANTLVKLNQELKFTQYLQETALTYLCTIPSKGAK